MEARLVAALLIAAVAARAQVVYTSAFAGGAGSQWSQTKTERTPNGTWLLGRSIP